MCIRDSRNRIAAVRSGFNLQEDVSEQANEILTRAIEITSQGINESNSPEVRAQMAAEVFAMRDHMVSLANTQYQGRYIYGGAADQNPPVDRTTDYTEPATGGQGEEVRYTFDSATGRTVTKTVQITDDFSLQVNTAATTVFQNSIAGLERLGRALAGYATTVDAQGIPTGAGSAYTFPADTQTQTTELRSVLDTLNTAREQDVAVHRGNLAGLQQRLVTGEQLLDSLEVNINEVLDRLQNVDIFKAATDLAESQNALQASMQVANQLLSLSILNFL